ncbi:MFS transporter [Amnibacterium flavum]|uniref:MFS transporter n=1 Tax=Amnibacterium flavum TaxID=2173173 RepID=A0A2V1HRD9_9MICO|nr:MFS transporter [Amnibacterium flavum]PVZ95135.1 hypothetical protein DDQ50_00970 [Amnibacterium flavum]
MRTRISGPRLVAVASALMFVGIGAGYYAITAIVDAVIAEGRFEVATVAVATAVSFIVNSVVTPLVARSIRVVGARTTIAVGGVVSAVGFAAIGSGPGWPWLIFGFAALGAGVAASSYLPLADLLVSALPRPAVGITIVYTGGSVGGMLLGPAVVALLAGLGSAALATIVAPLYALCVLALAASLPATAPRDTTRTLPGDGDASASKALIGPVVFLTVLGATTLAAQVQMLQVGRVLDIPGASIATVLMPAAAIVGRGLYLLLERRMPAQSSAALVGAVAVAGFATLAVPSSVAFAIGSSLVGLAMGLSVVVAPALVLAFTGRRDFSSRYAIVLLCVGLGYGAGSLLLPAALESRTTTSAGLLTCAVLVAFATVALLARYPAMRTVEATPAQHDS